MKDRKRTQRQTAGFTLIEIMAALLIAAVMTVLSTAAIASLSVASPEGMEARRVYAALRTARWKAVRSGVSTQVSVIPDEAGGASLVPRKRAGEAWTPDGDVIRIPPEVSIEVTGPPAKTFTPAGTSSFGSILLRGRTGVPYRLSLNPMTGRVRLWRGGKDLHDAE